MDTQTPVAAQPHPQTAYASDTRTPLAMPDPSVLTTQQLWREVASLKELTFSRMSAIEKAIEVAHQDLVRVPTDVQKAVGGLEALHNQRFESMGVRYLDRVDYVAKQHQEMEHLTSERFNAVSKQFDERDKRAELLLATSAKAVDAALAAAKQAVDKQNEAFQLSIAKSETATTKQMDGIQTTIGSLTHAFDDKINDLKDRITRNEGSDTGKREKSQSSGAMWGYVVGGIGALLGIAGFIMAMLRMGGKV